MKNRIPGQKIGKDKITFMPCSNASGTHKLNLLFFALSVRQKILELLKM